MAGDTNSNIFINIDTSQAMAQLRLLEKELTALNRSLIVGTKAAAAAQAKYAQSLLHNVNATGQWTASMTRMSTASEQFATNLDRQRLSLKEYFRYGAASTKTFGKFFGREFETIGKLVDKRVKTLQQQYVQLGRDAQGAMNAMKFTPKSLNMQNLTTQLMVATQKQQILNKLIDDGSTKLLNFGKNTQWAGRQLMVGFTIPLMLFGAQAIKTFKEIETQVIRFKKVYGDIFTDQGATNAALKNIRDLADEYTKYGLKVSDTIKMAADAAAAGFSGKGLEQLVEQTNKLAVLGGVTQEKALETTIALKNAFQIDTGAMAGTIDFLNAVENQTVVALDDLTEAIPKVAPVIQQLGGDVKDLAYFMAAMQEGGISAAQGANALKSGLASLINPSNAASKAAAKVGINIKGIVEANAGNLRNTVTGFAKALQPLTDLEKARVIEKVFGKYQFARISALLNNLGREGTQAARVLQLTNASVEELAILSQRELKIQADSPMNKLAGSVERLKASIAPIGELFAKVFTPVIEFITRMAEKFNGLPDGIKKAIGIITVVIGGLGPIFLMTFGLLANAVANSVKGVQVLRKGYQQLAAGSTDAALKTQYLSQEELENISISNALYSKHQQLSAAYALEANALASLTSAYTKATVSMGAFAANNPGMFMPRGGVILPKKFAGGTTSVPGPKGAGDVVPAMLSPGESVIPTKQTQKYAGFINQIIQDKVPGFMAGRVGALARVGRGASTRGTIGPAAPIIPITSAPLSRPGLSGIQFAEGADGLVTVIAGSQSFRVKKTDVDQLKTLLSENQTWLESKGRLPGGPISPKKGYADTTEGKLEHVLRTRLAGEDILTPKKIFSKLQKYDASKVRAVPKEIKSLRARYKDSPIYKELVATHQEEIDSLKLLSKTKPNPYGLTEEDLAIIQGAQGANAKEFKYSPALSHRFTDRQVDELPGLTQYKRNSPSNVFEEQSFLNKYFQDISKTSVGGMHISRRDQAIAARNLILDKPASKRSAIEKAVHATLDRRLNSGYYEKFGSKTNQLSLLKDAGLTNAQIAELPRAGVPGLAGGVVSLGMPIPFKVIAKNRAIAQQIDARVRSSKFRDTPPTNFGVKLEEFTGHSFPIPGIGGVYRKPNGQVVVVKPVLDEKAALAEQRGTVITRGAFKDLDAPEQTIRTMIDPTDLTGKRKIIVLESPYNPKFATGGTKFSKEEYFTQLLASTVRGDKDLSPSNVFGPNVADQGASGVFGKASGAREFKFNMPSLEEQAMINLLGVKGGARKAFAENTADIARSMTPQQYQDAMIAEINATIPRLEKTIASLGLTTGVEKIVYQRMVDRLKAGLGVDWTKLHAVHSKVKAPLELAEGIVSVPGPKGAGDIQPAMLSPGEAVIPAKQSAKYMPLIKSMIADRVPGFAGSNIEWDGSPSSLRPGGKYSGPVTPPGVDSWGDPIKDTPPAGTRSPDRVERAIDKFFDKPRVKKLGDRIDNFAAKVKTATPKVADLGKTAGDAANSTVKNTQVGTAMTKEELKNARQLKQMNNMGKNMGIGMAASMLPMMGMAQASTNPDGMMARNMSTLSGVAMLAMIAPMLNTPLKLLAGVALGYAAILKMQSAQIKKAIIEGNKLAESFSMTSKKLEDFGAITGTVSRTQVAEQQRLGRTAVSSAASQEFGENFLSSETGKKFKEDFTKLSEQYESAVAGQISTAQLASAVNQGVLSYLEAESIITKMARDLKDPNLEYKMQGQLMQILGPDGQDLAKNPLKVQLELIQANQTGFDAVAQNFQNVGSAQLGFYSKGEMAGLAGGALAGGAIAAKAYSSSLMAVAAQAQLTGTAVTGMSASMSALPVGRIIAVGAALGTLATRIFQRGKEAEAIGTAAGTLQGVAAQNFAAIQQSADALNYQYNVQISNLSLEKDRTANLKEIERITARIAELEKNRTAGLDALAQKQQDTINSYIEVVRNYKDNTEGVLQGLGETFTDMGALFNFIPGIKSKDEKMLAKSMDAAILGMQEAWNNSIGSKILGNELQGMDIEDVIRISLLVESKTVSPEQFLLLKDVVERNGKDINQVIKFTLENTDPETLSRISILLGRFETPTKQQGFESLTERLMGDPAKLKNVLTALEEYAKAPDSIPVNMGMEIDQSDIERLNAFGKEIDAIKRRFPNGQFDAKLLTKYQTELAGAGMPANATLDYVVNNIDYFMKLPKEKRFEAIFAFTMLKDADSVKEDIEKTLKIGFMKRSVGTVKSPYGFSGISADLNKQYDAWRKSEEGIKAYTTALKEMGLEWKGTGIEDSDVSGGPVTDLTKGPTRDMSWLNDLAQRLKLVKEGGFDALNPLVSLRKFLDDGGNKSINPGLDDQRGAIKQIEAAAKDAGISIDKDFMEIIRGLDAEQFKLWSATLFNVAKNGRITGLKEDFITINEGFRKATIGGYIQDVKDASREIENQVTAHELLTKEGYNSLEIQKILQNATLTAKIAAQGGLKATKEEQAELNKEIEKTINLNYKLSMIKLSDNISETKMQVEAFKRLTAAGVKHEVILEILKDKNNAFAIASADATVNTKDKFGDLINKTKEYSDLLELIANQTKTFEQKTQDAIDANISALDLQAKTLQNQFDLDNFELKAKIKLAEDAVQQVNNDIQSQQNKIDDINFTLKYDSNIGQNLLDDLQENISDAQRSIEINFDRPIQELSDRSNILSNDLTLIDKAAESINEKYDAQEKALQKISELNQDIATQEKNRISLADALSQGDISAAAQIANEMRSTAADAANRTSGDFLATARKSEIDGLVSASGMTRVQIEAEQFRISQQTFALEQQRKIAQEAILAIEDRIYNITELREVKLLEIRNIEQVIDGLKNNQLRSAQGILDGLQKELDKNQAILDAKLVAIEKEKLGWEKIQIALDAYKLKLEEINNGPLKTMKEIVDSIAAALSQINSAKYSPTSPFIPPATTTATPAQVTAATNAANAAADASDAANKKAEEELAAQLAAQKKADDEAAATSAALKKAIEATKKAIADAAKSGDPASKAYVAQQKAAADAEAARLAAVEKQKAQFAARATGLALRYGAMSNGGMVPKYFAAGGKAIGSDTVPAMLTPGEFVVNKGATKAFGPMLAAMNGSKYPSMLGPRGNGLTGRTGGNISSNLVAQSYGSPISTNFVTQSYPKMSSVSVMPMTNMSSANVNNNSTAVYNYSVGINVNGSNSSANDIARAVMTEIKNVDAQRIRNQRG
jgi:TP901 family phage tail tape measure protein